MTLYVISWILDVRLLAHQLIVSKITINMKIHLTLLFLISLILNLTAQTTKTPDEVYATMTKAYQNLDVSLLEAIYAQDAYYLSPSSDIRVGTASFIQDFTNMFANAKQNNLQLDIQFDIKNRKKLSRKTFLDVGIYTLTSTNAKGKKGKSQGKFTTVLEKNKKGNWQFTLDTYNDLSPLPQVEAVSSRIPENIIRDNIKQFSKDYVNGDIDALVASYTKDAKIFPNNTDILRGSSLIHDYWTPNKNTKTRTIYHKITPEEIYVTGNIAYDYGYYEGKSLTEKGEEIPWKGKYVIIWKEVELGVWKIYLDIWNRIK